MLDLTRTPQRDRYARMRQNIPKLSSYGGARTKYITSVLLGRRKERKMIHASRNRKRIGRYIIYTIHNTRAALKEMRLLSYNKTTNYF